MSQCVYSHCCLCLDSMSIICSCLCHAASVVSVPAMPLAPAEGGWTPPRPPPPPPPYSITATPYPALSLLPSAVLRRSQHGASQPSRCRTIVLSLSSFPSPPLPPFFSSLYLRHPFLSFRSLGKRDSLSLSISLSRYLSPGDFYGISARSVSARGSPL